MVRDVTIDYIEANIRTNQLCPDAMIDEQGPAMFVHVDNGPQAATQLLGRMLSSTEKTWAEERRWAIMNVWRPIRRVQRDHLALCDSRTVSEEDLVTVWSVPGRRFANIKGAPVPKFQVFNVLENPEHKWYFAPDMEVDELFLFTTFDSETDEKGRKRRVPHCAFRYDSVPDAPPRRSIEARFVVVW